MFIYMYQRGKGLNEEEEDVNLEQQLSKPWLSFPLVSLWVI